MNMTLIDGELRILFEFYDGDSCGMIDYELLIRSIRDPLTGLRLSLVNLAFDQLDRQGSGMVDAAEVASLYDATRHPDVMRGSTSSQQALSSFLETFDVGSVRQGKVTRQEFVNYYSNISESVENDDYFELIIRNVWHVDGHSDAQSQAANNRVMITRQDGSQHVEEYKDIRGYNSSNDQLMDRAEQEQKAVVIAKLQGRVPPGTQDAGSIIPIDSVHKIMQTNKRRSYQHRSTVGLLVDATVKQHSRHSGDRSHMQPTAGEQVLLDKIKGEVAVGGARGLVNLQRALRAADSDSNSLLSLPELKQALHAVHHTLSGPELRLLFSYFDPFATGFVGYEQVVEAVRNPLSAWRLALVKVRETSGLTFLSYAYTHRYAHKYANTHIHTHIHQHIHTFESIHLTHIETHIHTHIGFLDFQFKYFDVKYHKTLTFKFSSFSSFSSLHTENISLLR